MSANIEEILQVYGSIGEQVLKDALDKVSATHKTIQSIRSEVVSTETKDILRFIGREYIQLLEIGRKPTTKGPSPEMIEMLTDYARARGFDKPESAAWAIAKTINKEGDRTFRMGGRDVYSSELNKFVEELKKECSKSFAGFYLSSVKNTFNGANGT
jgi:hypothetical protein